MTKFTLGQRVTFTHALRRKHVRGNMDKIWERTRADSEWDDRKPVVPQVGIVVGFRTLSNGSSVDLGPDQGTGYEYAESVPAVMIVTHLRRRPVFAPPEAVEASA